MFELLSFAKHSHYPAFSDGGLPGEVIEEGGRFLPLLPGDPFVAFSCSPERRKFSWWREKLGKKLELHHGRPKWLWNTKWRKAVWYAVFS